MYEHRYGTMKPPSPWQPENGKVNLAVLGKLNEEANELGAVTARCIIQGIDGQEPVTKKPNRQWLQEEIADVMAGCELAVKRFGLDWEAIHARMDMKKAHKLAWHELIRENQQ
jgi:hypothetical protein